MIQSLVHPTAIISPWVELGPGCVVHPYAVVGRLPDRSRALAREPQRIERLVIGANVVIGCHTVIYGDVEIGDDCLIGDYASIREGARIGDCCIIGRQVTINYNAKIGNDCRLQDGTHITGDCVVGNECFFGPGVLTSNDRNVDLDDYHFPNPPQPCIFGKRVMVGSGANILAGARIGDHALIGAGAIIVKDVPARTVMLGKAATAR